MSPQGEEGEGPDRASDGEWMTRTCDSERQVSWTSTLGPRVLFVRGRRSKWTPQTRGVFFQRESAGKFPISLLKSLKITSVSYQYFSI